MIQSASGRLRAALTLLGETSAPGSKLALGLLSDPLYEKLAAKGDLDARDWIDGSDLATALRHLRHEVEHDSELADLHRKALRAWFTKLPITYIGSVVFDFCVQWLSLAPANHEARPLVEDLRDQLQALVTDSNADGREVVHGAVDAARRVSRPWRPLPRELSGRVVDRPARRPDARHRREVRPSQRGRARVRSGSRGDPPDDADDADPLHLGRLVRGLRGVVPRRSRP